MKNVIVITGASSGFGALAARALARAGHSVYASMRETTGRNAQQVRAVETYAAEHRVDLRAIELDVASQESADAAIAKIVAENGPDSAHFHYVHGATVTPVCLNWEAVDEEWRFLTGWPDARSDDPDKMALYIHSHFSGLGFAISAFEGSSNYRLIFACTPVEDGYSDMFYSIWWPRLPGDTSDVPPESVREQVESQFMGTVWDDLNIWRYQEYIENPALSKVDAKPYMAMRKWATQFYEVPASV